MTQSQAQPQNFENRLNLPNWGRFLTTHPFCLGWQKSHFRLTGKYLVTTIMQLLLIFGTRNIVCTRGVAASNWVVMYRVAEFTNHSLRRTNFVISARVYSLSSAYNIASYMFLRVNICFSSRQLCSRYQTVSRVAFNFSWSVILTANS